MTTPLSQDTLAVLLNQAQGEFAQKIVGLLERLQEGVWVIDELDRTTLVNQQMGRMLGYEPESMIGRSVFEFMTPAEADRCRQLLQRRRSGVREQHDFSFQRSDGSTMVALMETAPLFDSAMVYRGAIAGVLDVTRRKLAERELGRKESLLRETGKLAKVGGWEADLATGRLNWTDETYAIHDLAPGTPMTLEQAAAFPTPEYRPPAEAAVKAAIEQGEPFDMELEIETATGRRKWLHFIGQPELAHGRAVRLTGTLQDVTERHSMEQQLLQAQKMEAVGHLAGGVAHDFRNQLQVIKGFSELLLREGHVSDEGRELVEEVLQAAERSTRLTTSLLAFGRREVLRPEVVDLSTIVTELSKSLSRIIGEDIRLTIDTCQGPCRTNVDPAQLQQALVNLVVNAREAMPRGGAIQLETRTVRIDPQSPLADHPPPGHYAAVAVRDDGIGMDDDTLARAFEPFFTTKGRERGTGLGLSMVYGFVRQSGGTVRTESRLHEGTTIELLFPQTQADIEPRQSPSDQADTPPLSGTVLVCEDEDAVRKMITAACVEAGLEVIEAAGPTEALHQARDLEEPVDLLLTDVVMPDGSGTRLADELKQRWPRLAVLYVTGYPGKELARRNLGVRDETTLRKPFSRNKLIQAIHSLLSPRQSPAAS